MSRPFKEPVGVKATRPHTTGAIDPFHKRPPSRTNCSGLLPAVPRSRPPSPDATGVVWPVEVLQQQTKWQEAMDAKLLREHARELQLVNMETNYVYEAAASPATKASAKYPHINVRKSRSSSSVTSNRTIE